MCHTGTKIPRKNVLGYAGVITYGFGMPLKDISGLLSVGSINVVDYSSVKLADEKGDRRRL